MATQSPAEPQPASDLHRGGQPVDPADRLDPDLVGLHLQKHHLLGLDEVLMYPPALQAGFLLPAGDGALIEVEGGDDGLHRTAVSKQRHHREYQPLRLVYSVEGSTPALGEGPPATLAAITALLLAVDHDVTLSRTAVGAATSVVTELPVRVHANTSLVWRSETKQGCCRARI